MRDRLFSTRGWRRALVLLQALALTACGPSLDDLVERLEDPEERESARQELLLATDRAVAPLLAALEELEPGPRRARTWSTSCSA